MFCKIMRVAAVWGLFYILGGGRLSHLIFPRGNDNKSFSLENKLKQIKRYLAQPKLLFHWVLSMARLTPEIHVVVWLDIILWIFLGSFTHFFCIFLGIFGNTQWAGIEHNAHYSGWLGVKLGVHEAVWTIFLKNWKCKSCFGSVRALKSERKRQESNLGSTTSEKIP